MGKQSSVCIDLDGTVFDFYGDFSNYLTLHTDITVTDETWSNTPYPEGISADQFEELHEQYMKEKRYRSMPPIPGAKEALLQLYRAGYLLLFATVRPDFVEDHTADSLNELLEGKPHVLFQRPNKVSFLKDSADYYALTVDDNISFAKAAAVGGCPRVALVNSARVQGEKVPKGVRRVVSLQAAVNWLLSEQPESPRYKWYQAVREAGQ